MNLSPGGPEVVLCRSNPIDTQQTRGVGPMPG